MIHIGRVTGEIVPLRSSAARTHRDVYRSNHLVNLTAKDSEYLGGWGIRLVCDVRSDGERARAPDHWTGNALEFFAVPL